MSGWPKWMLCGAAVLLLGTVEKRNLGEPSAKDPKASSIDWSARCDDVRPCRIEVEGEVLVRTRRGSFACAEKDHLLICVWTHERGRDQAAWFVELETRRVSPVQIHPRTRVLGAPLWDPDGARLMIQRADGTLTTRTILPPGENETARPSASWWWFPETVRETSLLPLTSTGTNGALWTSTGHRFAVDTGHRDAPLTLPTSQEKDGIVRVHALGATPDGDVYMAGAWSWTADLGDGTVRSVVGRARGGTDAFLRRTGADGQVKWVRSWGGTGAESVYGVAVGSAHVVVLGRYQSVVDFDPGKTTDVKAVLGADDGVFLTRYKSDGTYDGTWTFARDAAPTSFDVFGEQLAFVGSFSGEAAIDPTNLEARVKATGKQDAFVGIASLKDGTVRLHTVAWAQGVGVRFGSDGTAWVLGHEVSPSGERSDAWIARVVEEGLALRTPLPGSRGASLSLQAVLDDGCLVLLGKGWPGVKAVTEHDLRPDLDAPSTFLSCARIGKPPAWTVMLPERFEVGSVTAVDGYLCVTGTVTGGPYDLDLDPATSTLVGDEDGRPVPVVGCMSLEALSR